MAKINPPRQGNLSGPLRLIGGNGEHFLVVQEGKEDSPNADAQLFDASAGILQDQIKPVAIWLKFLYLMEGIIPSVPFTKEEADLRIAAYKAAERARLAAQPSE